MAKKQATTTDIEAPENSFTRDRSRERFHTAVQYLLNCFDSMHHLEITECTCFVLKDVRTFLLRMRSSVRLKEFANVPSTTLDQLGFLEKKESARLDLTIVTKDELLLLFVVYHLSLNGKSHFEEVVRNLKNRAPPVVSMILSCASTPAKLSYLRKYPQYFRLDEDGHLELPSTFDLAFEVSSDDADSSSDTDRLPQSGNNATSCNVDSNFNSFEVSASSSVRNTHDKTSDVPLPESSSTCSKPRMTNENEISKDCKNSLAQKITLVNESLEKTAFEIKNVVHQSTVDVLQITDRICTIVREGIVFLFEHFKCPLDLHLVCVVLHALHEAKHPFRLLSQPDQMALIKKILAPLWVARVEDNSGTFLRPSLETFELSKEQKDLLFISYVVGQSDKLHCSTLLRMLKKHNMSIDTQFDAYFESRSTFFSIDEADTIKLENFPPAKWMTERLSTSVPLNSSKILFGNSGSPQLTNMDGISFGDLSLDLSEITKTVNKDKSAIEEDTAKSGEKPIKDIQENSVSEYSQDMLDSLSEKMYISVAYLSYFFQLNVHSGLLEVVMHVVKDCSVFFRLPFQQQVEVVKRSFCAIHIDGQGNIISIFQKKLNTFQINKEEKMLLCMSYIISLKRIVHHRQVFSVYHESKCEPRLSNHLNDSDQLEYLKSREDIFYVSSTGFVSLSNVSNIKFNYVSILMSRFVSGPLFFNPRPVMLRMNPSPMLFNPVMPIRNTSPMFLNPRAVMPMMNSSPLCFNPVMPRVNSNQTFVNPGAVMPKMNLRPIYLNPGVGMPINPTPMNFNTGCAIMPQTNSSHIILDDRVTSIREKQPLTMSAYESNFSVQVVSEDETCSPKVTCETKITKRVRDGISYLSQYFVPESGVLNLIFCVLADVKSYLAESPIQTREDFVEKCISHFMDSSRGINCGTSAMSNSCTLNDEEKIALFIANLLSQEKELNYKDIFNKFSEYNATVPTSINSFLDKYNFITNWKNIFSMSSNGNVKLLPIFMNDVSSSDIVLLENNKTNSSNQLQTGDSIKCVTEEENFYFQNNSTCIKSKDCASALRFYCRIEESMIYLIKTFKVVSCKHAIRTIFYVLHDVRNLFTEKSDFHRRVLESMLSFIIESKTTHLGNELNLEMPNVNQEEKNMLLFICISIVLGPMRCQELFSIFQSHGGDIRSLHTSLTAFNLDSLLKDGNLETSLQSVILEGGSTHALKYTDARNRSFKLSSSSIQRDVLESIHDICNDALKVLCNTKSVNEEMDDRSSDASSAIDFPVPTNTKSVLNVDAVSFNTANSDFVPNQSHLIDMKSTDDSLTKLINKDNPQNELESLTIPGFSEKNEAVASDHNNIAECRIKHEKNISFHNRLTETDFLAPQCVDQNEICKEAVSGKTTSSFNLLELQSDDEFSAVSTKAANDMSTESCARPVSRQTGSGLELLELHSRGEPYPVSAKTAESNVFPSTICGCTIDLTTELRTVNFLNIILSMSKIGLPVPVLKKKLLLASSEVQHYISCVYKGNVMIFLGKHEKFYISPTSGNICCKS